MRNIVCFFVFISFIACENNDCLDTTLGPPSVYMSFLDSITDTNIYLDSTYNYAQIKVFDIDSNSVYFNFIEEDSVNQLVVFPPYLEGEVKQFRVSLNDTLAFDFSYDVEAISSECNTNYFIRNISSDAADVVLDNYVFEVKF